MPIELQKHELPLRFKYSDDVFFLVKPHANARDIFNLRNCGTLKADGAVAIKGGDISDSVLQSFVVGWEGVQVDGKPVSYSWELFISSFPRDNKRDVFLEVAAFIFEKTDINIKDKTGKKD
jgi:hypothetical protein